MWSEQAQNLTFRAITQAGFSSRYFKGFQGIYLASEPEAAALYTLKSLLSEKRTDEDHEFIEVRLELTH